MSRETAKLFTPENILHVGKMREQYFKTGSADGITGVREEILKGWKLSYNSPFREPYSQKPTVRNLQAHLERSKRLLDVAIPYMKKLHSFLQQKSFWLTLLDDKGVIIKLVGSPEMLAELTATGLVEGSDRGSDVPYCGLFHLEYLMKKPFMLVATEHASPVDDNLAGAACPIIDLNKEVPIGFLAVSGHWWDSHVHTLGLVIIAAEAISQQIRLREANLRMKELNAVVTHVNHRLKRTVENVNSGLIYIDNAGRIKMINRAAVVLLGIKKEEADVVGTNVFAYLDADITVDIIRRNTADGKTFQYALSNSAKHRDMYHTRSSLYLFVNTMGGDADEQGGGVYYSSLQAEQYSQNRVKPRVFAGDIYV